MKLLKGLFYYHILPIGLSAIAVVGILNYFSFFDFYYSKKLETIKTPAVESRGRYVNCQDIKAQIEFIGSLKNKSGLTLLGSSEFSDSPYSPYYFLPDSIGIPTIAIGHAYHQNLSIACELLAAGDALEGANVCIILSPGWFQTDGTNIQAFLEFVPKRFLQSIICNNDIPEKDKLHIAQYIYKEYQNIENPSNEFRYFNLYSMQFARPTLSMKTHKVFDISNENKFLERKSTQKIDWGAIKKRLKDNILNSFSNNNIFVDSSYFRQYIQSQNPSQKSIIEPIKIGNEFDDFKMVVDILKRKHCNATFVFQPLNPYYYEHLERFEELIKKIQMELQSANFPLLNLFSPSVKSYESGILKDIMHLSDMGWNDVNQFLTTHYYETKK